MKKIIFILCLLLSFLSLELKAQDYNYLVDSAASLYYKGQFNEASGYYNKYFSLTNNKDYWKLIRAAESYALTQNLDSSFYYLRLCYKYGSNNNIMGIYYDLKLKNLWTQKEFESLHKNNIPDSVLTYFDFLRKIETSDQHEILFTDITLSSGHQDYGYLDDYSLENILERLTILKIDPIVLKSIKRIRLNDCNFQGPGNKFLFIDIEALHMDRATGNLSVKDVNIGDFYIHDSNLDWLEIQNSSQVGVLQIQNDGSVVNINNSEFKLGVPDPNKNIYPSGYKRKYFNLIDLTASEKIQIDSSSFGKNEDVVIPLLFISNTNDMILTHSTIDQELIFQGESKHLNFYENEIKGYIDLIDYTFPEFNNYIPFYQLENRLVEITVTGEINGDSISDIENTVFYDKLINTYKTLYNNYRNRGELNSANDSYIVLKELEIAKLKTIPDKPFKENLRLWLNQLMGVYTDYGTNPAKAILVSTYIILLFSLFYLFFPSKWDKKYKKMVSEDFKEVFTNGKNGGFKSLFRLLKRLSINFINAVTLSTNAFITLGFGRIPTTGIARYVCIFQGLLGWFLLSLFTVALINQVLL